MSDLKSGERMVDEYIKSFPEYVQVKLNQLRKLYREEIPDYEETISYGIPTYKRFSHYVLYFAAFKDHISIYPATSTLPQELSGLEDFKKGKGTFQFKLNQALPLPLIKGYLRLKITENEAKYGNTVKK